MPSTSTLSVGARGLGAIFSRLGEGALRRRLLACRALGARREHPGPSLLRTPGVGAGQTDPHREHRGRRRQRGSIREVSRPGLTRSKSPGTVTFRLWGSPGTVSMSMSPNRRAIAAVSWAWIRRPLLPHMRPGVVRPGTPGCLGDDSVFDQGEVRSRDDRARRRHHRDGPADAGSSREKGSRSKQP